MMANGAAMHWLRYRLGLAAADTQTTAAEQACLRRHAAGRRAIVELGVMHGATTGLLRSVMAADGTIAGVDPHPRGRLGVSFERLVASREIAKHRRGTASLIRLSSADAARTWSAPIDFLFIDADHSWSGIENDWRRWTPHVVAGGLVALHDSRSVPDRPDPDSVRFTTDVVGRDARFRELDAAYSLTILERVP